jgi:eukaryotic-like serine/threonine-protein kinase
MIQERRAMPPPADRNLLFGLLALQTGMIDQSALVAAFHAWTRHKTRSMAELLLQQGAIDADDCSALEILATSHLKRHGDDVEKSLAAVPAPRSVMTGLAGIDDVDVAATLGHVCTGSHATEPAQSVDANATTLMGGVAGNGQRFRVLRPHARGGLGEVFIALDAELNREVALKQILDHHADDPNSRTRFILEAEITGGLEHPGIVPVYGLGSYGSGRPYYAMRLVRGDSLKDAIAAFHADPKMKADPGRRSLALRKLLRRFTDVCNAIEYAHTRGVIHRDIKPANVIVGKHGETLVVDWGLAKAVGRSEPGAASEERTLMPSSSSGSAETLPGSAMGTPAYMSPEQAVGNLDCLGPRSDVYSLGATLYCLLTGMPPFEGDDLGAVLRLVGKGEFPPPRSVDPTIDRALEAVCLKAMALEARDRYERPKALADDLERWAADEPVSAWREPLSRRMRRWARRNRTAVAVAAAGVLVALIGTGAVLIVQTKANADLSRSQAAVQARYDLAVDAIKTFHTGVSEDFLLKQDQFRDVRDRLLKSASDFYGKLGALLDKESDLGSRRAVGQANFEVAELTGKVGKPEDALAAHRQVLAANEALLAELAANPEIKADLGRSLTAVARLLEITGQTKEAEATYRKAETLLVALAPTIAETGAARVVLAKCRTGLGWLLHTIGRDDEALSVLGLARADQELMAATPGAPAEFRRDLSDTIIRVARVLEVRGRSTEAAAEFREALAIQQKLADDNPAVTDFQNRLASSHNNLGNLLRNTGEQSEAAAEFHKALAVQQKLADDNPAVTQFRSDLANNHNSLGFLLSQLGKQSEAEAEYRQALAVQQKLADDNPAVTPILDNLALIHNNIGWLLYQKGMSVEAEAEYRKGLAIQQKLADDNPTIPRFQRNLANSLLGIGWQLAQAKKLDEAIGYYKREEVIRRKVAEASSAAPESRDYLANCQTNTADVLRRSGRLVEALAACERALAVREPLVAAHSDVPYYVAGLGETYMRLGQVRRDMQDLAGAADAWRRASATYERSKPLNGENTFFRGCSHACMAGLAGRPGSGVSVAEGADHAEKAMALLREAVTKRYRNPDTYQSESALDPLRGRSDFQALLMDLVFPTNPFAK